jgi:hypothetical protein
MEEASRRGRAKSHVEGHFPSMRDVEPTHSTRRQGEAMLHVYTFKKKFTVEGGTLSQVIRVFVDEAGKVVKAVSSK